MNQTLITNLLYASQVSLFVGIALLIFAWVEKKLLLERIGQALYVALGLMAFFLISSGQVQVPEVIDGQVSKEARIFSFLFGLKALAVLAVIGFLMRYLQMKYSKWVNALIIIASIALFFMVNDLMKG